MKNRERVKAILHYEPYDRLPLVHFGYWIELLEKWHREGHLTLDEITEVKDSNKKEKAIDKKLGFDFNWYTTCQDKSGVGSLFPAFEQKILEEYPDGKFRMVNEDGVIVMKKEGARSIPTEVDHLLVDRASWEEFYLPRLQYGEERFDFGRLKTLAEQSATRDEPLGIYCKSLFGQIRNWMGVVGISYLYSDDEDLYDEIIDTVGGLAYQIVEKLLSFGIEFDFAHYWEDICFKNGPLIQPSVFEKKVGPHYKKINSLLNKNHIDIISLDCDGMIDALIPTWLSNGVNTMFPIEVGTWGGSIGPWREIYGRTLRGVGGVNKNIFAGDYQMISDEIERLKPLVESGGYIPCIDHRIPPEAKWDNVRYYCDRMRNTFG